MKYLQKMSRTLWSSTTLFPCSLKFVALHVMICWWWRGEGVKVIQLSVMFLSALTTLSLRPGPTSRGMNPVWKETIRASWKLRCDHPYSTLYWEVKDLSVSKLLINVLVKGCANLYYFLRRLCFMLEEMQHSQSSHAAASCLKLILDCFCLKSSPNYAGMGERKAKNNLSQIPTPDLTTVWPFSCQRGREQKFK